MGIRDTGVQSKSNRLQGRRLAVAVCGGIGAVEVVKIIRELRRHGASVVPFMTPSSQRFVGRDALAWAAGVEVVAEASPNVEYLEPFDLVVVAPATLHSVAKAALALTDNVVALLLASHLGAGKRTLFVPAMNAAMKQHPRYAQYREQLTAWGSVFLETAEEEDRMKMPTPEQLVEKVLEIL